MQTAKSSNGRGIRKMSHDEIVDLTQRVFTKLQQELGDFSEAWPSVTMQQLRVMLILYREGATRVSVLARRLDVSTPTVTGILDRLVRQGLTYRADDPRDRRVVLNALTDEGVAAIEKIQTINAERLRGALDRLDKNQQQSIADALARLVEAVDTE
jgi:DNA-binding MarR family transcriptional regulator